MRHDDGDADQKLVARFEQKLKWKEEMVKTQAAA